MTAALAGARSEPPGNGRRGTFRARGCGAGGPGQEFVGAVVTISGLSRTRPHPRAMGPARRARAAPVVALVAVAWPVSAWVLRPVRELDAASSRISRGDLTFRGDAEAGPVELRRLAESFNTMMDAVENAVQRQRAFVSDARTSCAIRYQPPARRGEPGAHLRVTGGGRQVYDIAVDELKAMQRMLNSLRPARGWRAYDGVAGGSRRGAGDPGGPVAGADGDGGSDPGGRVPPGLGCWSRRAAGHILDELISDAFRLSGARVVEVTAGFVPGGTGAGDASGDVVTITVRDDGEGIDASERAQALGNGSGGHRGTRTCRGPAWGWRSAPTWSGRPGASCGWRTGCRVRTGPGADSPRWSRCLLVWTGVADRGPGSFVRLRLRSFLGRPRWCAWKSRFPRASEMVRLGSRSFARLRSCAREDSGSVAGPPPGVSACGRGTRRPLPGWSGIDAVEIPVRTLICHASGTASASSRLAEMIVAGAP